jgi:hypothetical protein
VRIKRGPLFPVNDTHTPKTVLHCKLQPLFSENCTPLSGKLQTLSPRRTIYSKAISFDAVMWEYEYLLAELWLCLWETRTAVSAKCESELSPTFWVIKLFSLLLSVTFEGIEGIANQSFIFRPRFLAPQDKCDKVTLLYQQRTNFLVNLFCS